MNDKLKVGTFIKTLPVLFLVGLLFLPKIALAVDTEFGEAGGIEEYISIILEWVVPIVGGLAFLMLIYAGYKYITSQGNPEATKEAKDIIIGVLVGIALLFLIELILNQLVTK